MQQLEVTTVSRAYNVYVGSNLLKKVPDFLQQHGVETKQSLFLISDSEVAPLYANNVLMPLRAAGYTVTLSVVPAGEQSKSLAVFEKLVSEAIVAGLDRSSVVLALGGGVVGDLAGFFAATFMRGIPFVQLPTTLLAHDSSIGGKVGINHPQGKNYIGAFHQPLFVLFDVNTLISLPRRELVAGFAEVIKHGLIWDNSFVRWLSQHYDQLLAKNSLYLEEAIARGCKVKINVVSEDEKEQGKRAILNYGHTLGHALESISDYKYYTHGEAISIGMVAAAMLSVEILDAPKTLLDDTIAILKQFSLPTTIDKPWSTEALLQLMKRDKKAKYGDYTFVLSKKMGQVEVVTGIDEEKIRKVVQQLGEVT
jgi:3-dehydroquinate synthase